MVVARSIRIRIAVVTTALYGDYWLHSQSSNDEYYGNGLKNSCLIEINVE